MLLVIGFRNDIMMSLIDLNGHKVNSLAAGACTATAGPVAGAAAAAAAPIAASSPSAYITIVNTNITTITSTNSIDILPYFGNVGNSFAPILSNVLPLRAQHSSRIL